MDWNKMIEDEEKFEMQRYHDKMDEAIKFNSDAGIQLGLATLKGVLLINGGAAVAMLGFAASLVNVGDKAIVKIDALSDPITWFAYGVAVSVIACALGYLSLHLSLIGLNSVTRIRKHPYNEENTKSKCYHKIANVINFMAMIVVIASIVLFVCGVISVGETISHKQSCIGSMNLLDIID